MNKEQIKLYSVDTKAFYTMEERNYNNIKFYADNRLNNIYNYILQNDDIVLDLELQIEEEFERLEEERISLPTLSASKTQSDLDEELETELTLEEFKEIFITKDSIRVEIDNEFKSHPKYEMLNKIYRDAIVNFNDAIKSFEGTRKLNKNYLNSKNQVSLFESNLTRSMKFQTSEVTNCILILRPFHYVILEQLVNGGYDFRGQHHILLTSSSGQLRGKKAVFVNEELWTKYEKTLLCGLTKEKMNNSKELGMNLGKFLAYVALNNSSTDEWTAEEGFMIDNCIVIKDFETMVYGEVDYIDVDHKVKEFRNRRLTKEERSELDSNMKIFTDELKDQIDIKGYRKTEKAKNKIKLENYKNTLDLTNPVEVLEKVQIKADELKKELDSEIEKKKKELNENIKEYREKIRKEMLSVEVCDLPITRQFMNVPVPHSDGCGWVLPSVSDKNFMVRLAWIKGLLTTNDFIEFCKNHRKKLVNGEWVDDKGNYTITDMYGREHNLLTEKISVIFTESQFKANKYYTNTIEDGKLIKTGWEQYQEYFKEFDCKANKCKVEKDKFKKASLNYQMFQTLTDMTDGEIEYFTNPVDEFITKGYTDLKTQLEIVGATAPKNNLQQAIKMCPEMLQEFYCKQQLQEALNKKKKLAKFGKFKTDAVYTFIVPDILAWNEFVFNEDPNPKGLLADGEVSCKLYSKVDKLCVNRSPHLYHEVGCRKNVVNKDTNKWLTTNAIYTSTHDLISKLLNFDSDGDESLLIADSKYYEIGERNMKGIVPLYYKMSKAKAQLINNENLYQALVNGYKFSNIGQYSNKITNLWNEENIDLDAIKILTCLNNFFIDGAKTGFMIEISQELKERLKKSNGKNPYFFKFAKDKENGQIKEINNSTVNKICKNIESIGQGDYHFSKLGKFKYTTLLINENPMIDEEARKEIIKTYRTLDNNKNYIFAQSKLEEKEITYSVFDNIKKELNKKAKELDIAYLDMVDVIVRDVYVNNKDSRKKTIWEVFGTTIIENMRINIKKPVEDGSYILCEDCGKHIKNEKNKKYCSKCSKERIKERDRNRKKK